MASVPAFQASGLASKLDTQGIIDKLVSIEAIPLSTLATKQAAISVKVSSLGTLTSLLDAVSAQAKFLSTNGLNPIVSSGSHADYSVSGAPANSGTYSVRVEQLARAAKSRSTTLYTAATDVVTATAKTLKLSVNGTTHSIDVAAGTTLGDLATQINGANKPFTAAVMSDGTQYYLTITNKETGFTVGQSASSALSVVDDGNGPEDLGLGLASPAALLATNAVAHVDGLRIERSTNELTSVVPGTTLNLKAASNTADTLAFTSDSGSAAGMINVFIANYNKAAAFLKSQVETNPASPTTNDKLGSSVVLNIQRKLEQIISTPHSTNGSGAQIRSLKDLGVTLQKDGTLKLDSSVLSAAIAKDPTGANNVFGKATTGIGATMTAFVKAHTDTNGILVNRRKGLELTTKSITKQAEKITHHLEAFRRQLNIQFTSLERIMGSVNNIAQFLDSQDAQLRARR